MKFLFRVDASHHIGSGHVMRCLTLAQFLRDKGAESTFVCRALPGNLSPLIEARGFRVLLLPCSTADDDVTVCGDYTDRYESWLGDAWQNDAAQTILHAEDIRPDWMIIDHYALDAKWEQIVRPYAGRLCVFDDLANRPHVTDVLLDQNLGRTPVDYQALVPAHTVLLTGPAFMLLREEFRQFRQFSLDRRRSGTGRKVLVTMGGSDEHDATGAVLSALEHCSLRKELEVTVVMSSQSVHLDRVAAQSAQSNLAVKLEIDVNNMAWHMAHNDLAIGAVGGTAWERCCLGLPTLMVVIADNQSAGAMALASSGAAELVGDISDIERRLPDLMATTFNANNLRTMAERASGITDGRGAERVVSQLLGEGA